MDAKPIVIIMAAGLGSRYGGLKQMDPVDDAGNVILHYSVHDAAEAGFSDFVFVIRRENEEDFKERITSCFPEEWNIRFAFQETSDIPDGAEPLVERTKPWGTGHAVRACRGLIQGRPFLVINADDYYGKEAFRVMFAFLTGTGKRGEYAMVGYLLKNTVTENGHVARGICECDENGFLTKITERTRIEKKDGGIAFTEDDGQTWTELMPDTPVSMNFWGFTPDFMEETDRRFLSFLQSLTSENALRAEYFLPGIVEQLLEERKCTVRVLPTTEKWYGVTYREDKPVVMKALGDMKAAGLYPNL